ncbi:MAG: aspartate aminotransferase family protein [Candidatus Hermodarchaeia archaeon]|jgi:4-aminobutyrate aminotransferase-like enzyme
MGKIDLNTLGYPDAPKIVTTPPGPKSEALFQKIMTRIPLPVYGARPTSPVSRLIWDSAKGDTVRDADGNIFIDWTAGYHMTNVHSPTPVIEAISKAATRLVNTANWSFDLRYQAAEKLLSVCPSKLDTVVIGGGSGSEATLAAVQAATHFTKRNNIIQLKTHYHGLAGIWHGPNVNSITLPSCNCYICPYKMEYPDCDIFCAEFLEQVIKPPASPMARPSTIAAVILEPWVRAHGTPKGFLTKLRKVCTDNDVLLIADEITSGMGRSGKWWMCDWENVVPDILCTAKGLTMGFPGNAIVTTKEIADALPPGSQIHSYAANAMVCAGLIATIDYMKELDLVNNANVVGENIRKGLLELQNKHEMIGSVNSKGFNVGVTLVKDRTTKETDLEATMKVFLKWFQKGVLNYGYSWTSPPLSLTQKHADKSLELLDESMTEVENE